MRPHIPYGRQNINDDDISSVIEILKSDYLTQGSTVPKFEEALANYCGANYCVAVNSATSALHVACLALELKQSDVVWTSPITFVATANCVKYCGATVEFIDIDPLTFNISISKIREKLASAVQANRLPKAIIPVHMCGSPCEMRELYVLCRKFDIKIIEDASHAIGAKYDSKKVGSCEYSDMTVFSFHPVKIITTGEGGAILTNDMRLTEKLRMYRSHGVTSDRDNFVPRSNHEIWNYQQFALGYNYRMTDIQAALGLSQLNRLDKFISDRNDIALSYRRLLKDLPVESQEVIEHCVSSYHLFVVLLDNSRDKFLQKKVYRYMRENGIMVNIHYIPVYRQPFYEKLNVGFESFRNSDIYFSRCLSLPIYPGLTELNQERVVLTLKAGLTL